MLCIGHPENTLSPHYNCHAKLHGHLCAPSHPYPLISPVDPSTYPVPRSHGLRPCPLCRTDKRAIHTLPCMMASAHVHCDGHASAPSDTSCTRLDGLRPCTEHLGPLHRTSGQASAPLESVEESAPLHSLSGQASALSSSGMSAFSNLSSRGTTTSHNAYVPGGRGTSPLFWLHLQRGAAIPQILAVDDHSLRP